MDEQTQELREALKNARDKLAKQDALLKQLTTPPFVFATVVRVSTDEKKQNGSFIFINGDSVTLSSQTELDGVEVGELLKAIPGTNLNDDVLQAKTLEVVGFMKNGTPVIQVDGDRVVESRISSIKGEKYTRIGKSLASVAVTFENKFFEVEVPEREVKAGDQVLLNPQTMQIVDVAKPIYAGGVSIVRRAIDETTSEVETDGSVRVVLNGTLKTKPEVGDHVVLDPTTTIIGWNLGKEDDRFSFTAETNVTWDDIGGLVEAKKQMVEAIELPFRYPDIYKHYNKKPVKGVLLYGPPGCGKTMLGKAAATALAKLHNGNSISSGFIYVKGPEVLDRFVGVAEATIRQIFQRSRKLKEQHGYPAVIFIDEADAILGKRGMGISSDIERTIVPQFLSEMDGLEETGAIVLLATNRADILDPAVTRDGRVDRKVKISRPDLNASRDIFGLYLKQVPLYNGYTREKLSNIAALELFSDKRVLYSIRLNGNHKGETRSFTLGNLASGAMIAGIVDQATSIALHRDIANGKPQGMSKNDLMQAVECTFCQNFDLNHKDELADFVHDFRDDVVNIRKLRQSAGAAAN